MILNTLHKGDNRDYDDDDDDNNNNNNNNRVNWNCLKIIQTVPGQHTVNA
jgi:hypothetical protein